MFNFIKKIFRKGKSKFENNEDMKYFKKINEEIEKIEKHKVYSKKEKQEIKKIDKKVMKIQDELKPIIGR